MGYIKEKTGPMCSVGKDNGKLIFKMLVGGKDEMSCELTEEEYNKFPAWDKKTLDKIKEQLINK